VFPCRDGVSLSFARDVRGHPPYGRLSVRKYDEVVEFVPSAGCRLKGVGDGCAFRIVRFLCATHVRLESLPCLVLLLHDRVSGDASLHTGAIGEDDQAWSLPFRFIFGSRFIFDDCCASRCSTDSSDTVSSIRSGWPREKIRGCFPGCWQLPRAPLPGISLVS